MTGDRVLAGTARSQVAVEGAAYPVELQEKVDAYLEQLAWSEEAEEPGDAEGAAEAVVARLAAEWGHPVQAP